ncbi:MAG: Flp pilus assembly protein CpaB [Caulobacteraceae bacterium]|nr:Flp pilus assembly protein CpaB [Caulobacteraceae bacterium]
MLRNLLLIVGAMAIVVGLAIAAYLLFRPGAPRSGAESATRVAVLVAAHPLPSGALLREGDLGWREIEAKAPPTGSLARGQVSQAQFVGAVARRDFAAGEMITASALVAPGDRNFLAAALAPGRRAATIAVDAAQSASGLILPGDRVDVILVQDMDQQAAPGAATTKKSVAQVLLRDVRVMAVDRTFAGSPAAAGSAAPGTGGGANAPQPRTITLEVTDLDAQRLFLALQLGKVELTLRALANAGADAAASRGPVWGNEVSALRVAANAPSASVAPPGSLLGAASARRSAAAHSIAPIRILRGSKADAQ